MNNLLQYNTNRTYLGLKEYGRHIQKMVDYLLTLEDRDKRNQQARAVIELMGFLNPHLKNVDDFRHMLWDHLFAMSDFKLDVDSPYPIPQKETYKLKGEPMKYPSRHPKYSHLGKNLELIIDKALAEPDQERKVEFANSIAYYMKLTYNNWHKEVVHDDTIRNELNIITKGQLEFNSTPSIKHSRPNVIERDDFNKASSANTSISSIISSSSNGRKQSFGNSRNNDTARVSNSNGTSGRAGRTDSRSGGSTNKNNSGARNGKNGGSTGRSNDTSRNFKKRF